MTSASGNTGRFPPAVQIERRPGGELLLTCPYSPKEPARSIPAILQARAVEHPGRPLLGRRVSGQWETLSYGEAWTMATRVAMTLVSQGLSRHNNIAILCPRSFQHFALAFGAQLAGVPVAPVSTPYSLLSDDHAKLKFIIGLLEPSLLLVEDRQLYARALDSLDAAGLLKHATVVDASTFDEWLAETPTDEWVETALNNIGHDTVARYMFTSGSTGMPKGVIYTQHMMVNCIAMHNGLNRGTPVQPEGGARVLEWMPWSHTSAGVQRINGVIASGGTIYFDTGRPIPGEYDETLRNIREVMPTRLVGAPVGHAMLADALEQDDELNRLVFGNISSLGFGSAAMAPTLFERLQNLSIKATGARINVISSLGATEVIGATTVYWPMQDAGNIGLPIPGVTIKLVPNGGKLEMRIKGNTVTPGYYREPEKTAASFDEEGFFKMGDAVRFVDPDVPEKGLAFDGRVTEDFKLVTGTWVSAGTLRTQVITSTSPYLRDVIICGLNQSFVAIMAWPNVDACSKLLELAVARPLTDRIREIVNSPTVIDAISQGLSKHNRLYSGSSTRIQRFLLLEEPPSMDGNELTEKGYINQRATLERRAHLVERLYASSPPDDIAGRNVSKVIAVP